MWFIYNATVSAFVFILRTNFNSKGISIRHAASHVQQVWLNHHIHRLRPVCYKMLSVILASVCCVLSGTVRML
jgi:hypothetical protein